MAGWPLSGEHRWTSNRWHWWALLRAALVWGLQSLVARFRHKVSCEMIGKGIGQGGAGAVGFGENVVGSLGFKKLQVGVSENSVPLNPMVLLIIIPMKNGYFIGNINPTCSDKPKWICASLAGLIQLRKAPRSHHSKRLGLCVPRMDHYCSSVSRKVILVWQPGLKEYLWLALGRRKTWGIITENIIGQRTAVNIREHLKRFDFIFSIWRHFTNFVWHFMPGDLLRYACRSTNSLRQVDLVRSADSQRWVSQNPVVH